MLLTLGSGRQDGREVLEHQSSAPRGIPLGVKGWGQLLQGPPLEGKTEGQNRRGASLGGWGLESRFYGYVPSQVDWDQPLQGPPYLLS